MPLRYGVPCLLLVALSLGGCGRQASGSVAQPQGPVKLVLQLDDGPRAELGGFFQALAKGYYRQAGLEVEIVPGAPGPAAGAVVSEGRADFGLGRSDDILVATSLGRPLQMVAAAGQHDSLALLVHAGSTVKTAADLKGRTVFAAGGPAWAAYLQKRHHLAFTLKPPPPALAGFLAAADAIQAGYATSDLIEARRRGADVRAIPLGDAQHDGYRVIFCRPSFAQQNPAVVRAFVAASLLGWRDFLDNDPTPAFALMRQRNPALTPDLLDYARGELILGRFIAGDPAKGEYLGALSFDRLGRELDLLLELGVMTTPVAINAVASKEYLPPDAP